MSFSIVILIYSKYKKVTTFFPWNQILKYIERLYVGISDFDAITNHTRFFINGKAMVLG